MSPLVILDLAILLCLGPGSAAAARPSLLSTPRFWAIMGASMATALALVSWRVLGRLDASLGTSIWLSIGATLAVSWAIAFFRRSATGLIPLLAPYLLAAGALATVLDAGGATIPATGAGAVGAWVALHVVVSLGTYALVTIAAVAGLAVMLREAALKTKREGALVGVLPPLSEADQIQFRSMVAAEIVLGLGIVSGMAIQLATTGSLLTLDHKTVLSLTAYAVLGALLVAHVKAGLRGRRAARFALVAYLLLTLAYPGVKAVQQFLLDGAPG